MVKTNNAQKVTDFLTHNKSLEPICDDCMAQHVSPLSINRLK